MQFYKPSLLSSSPFAAPQNTPTRHSPQSNTTPLPSFAPVPSTLSIPVSISVDEILRSLNTRLAGKALFEDYSYDDNGHDGLMMNAWNTQEISLFFAETPLYRVPLKLWIKKEPRVWHGS